MLKSLNINTVSFDDKISCSLCEQEILFTNFKRQLSLTSQTVLKQSEQSSPLSNINVSALTGTLQIPFGIILKRVFPNTCFDVFGNTLQLPRDLICMLPSPKTIQRTLHSKQAGSLLVN